MDTKITKMPAVNANDDHVILTKWLVDDGAYVKKEQVIAVAETTKTSIDIHADTEGYISFFIADNVSVKVGEPIFGICKDRVVAREEYVAMIKNPLEKRWTKKAELVSKKMGIDIEDLANLHSGLITEADVIAFSEKKVDCADLVDDKYSLNRRQRLVLIGGGGGGGAIALDVVLRTTHQKVVGIFDRNPSLAGKTLMDVPILGVNEDVLEYWKKSFFDAAVVVITANIQERKLAFDFLKKNNIPVENIIDPSVQIRSNVVIGKGNLIMPNGYFAPCVQIGDNNFFATGATVEHHSVIGSHCTFGPRLTTSGGVNIGDATKFGMGVLLEPYVRIGSNSLIPSGAVVTKSIPEKHVLQIHNNYLLKDLT